MVGEIAETVLNSDENEDSSDNDIENSGETTPINNIVKIWDYLIAGLAQRAFINTQHISRVYSIKETLLRQKPILMSQM